jgi:hypothetical protein
MFSWDLTKYTAILRSQQPSALFAHDSPASIVEQLIRRPDQWPADGRTLELFPAARAE